jgi:hypothetical protein
VSTPSTHDSWTFETLDVRFDAGVLLAEISSPPMNRLGPELVRDLVSLRGDLYIADDEDLAPDFERAQEILER